MKITYEDKVNLQTSAVPRKNKVTDADFNEIKQVVNTNAGVVIYNNSANDSADITFDDISDYTMIEVFYTAQREVGNSETTQTILGSQKIIDPIGKCFNVLFMSQARDDKHSKGYTATFQVSSTGITKIASSLFELNQTETPQFIMNSNNVVFITYILGYK